MLLRGRKGLDMQNALYNFKNLKSPVENESSWKNCKDEVIKDRFHDVFFICGKIHTI